MTYLLQSLSDTTFLIDGTIPLPVTTHVFLRAKADRAIVAFDTEQLDFVTDGDRSATALSAMLSDVLNSNPDGGVLWVPAAYGVAFVQFAAQALREAAEMDEITFDNGGVSEGFFVHTVEDGLAVLLFDPECGSGVFDDIIERFVMTFRVPLAFPLSTTFDPTRLQWFEDSHLCSNLAIGRRTKGDAAMLLGLYERGVLDERFALDLNTPLSGAIAAFFQRRPVAVTGDLAPYPGMTAQTDGVTSMGHATMDGWWRQWLDGTAHAQVVPAPVENGVLIVGSNPDLTTVMNASKVGCSVLRAADLVAGLVQAFLTA